MLSQQRLREHAYALELVCFRVVLLDLVALCLSALCCGGTVLYAVASTCYFIAYFCPNRWSKDQARRKNLTTFK